MSKPTIRRTKDGFPSMLGDRLTLRLPRLADSLELGHFFLRNREYFAKTIPSRSASFYQDSEIRKYIERARADFREDRGCLFLVFSKEDAVRVAGTVNFFSIIRGSFQACFLGYQIDETLEGRGLMAEAVRLGIDFVFSELNLHRVMANCWPENTRSIALLRRLGFDFEGYAKDYLRIGDRWVDHHMTAITNPDWKAPAD